MTILIWVVCVLAMAGVQTALKSNGIILGGIPTAILYIVTVTIANALTRAWKNRKK